MTTTNHTSPSGEDAANGAMPDTGNAEADRIINRLSSSDPDFDDCIDAVAFIRKLVAEHKGPEGFATWKDAALDERHRRLAAEKRLRDTSKELICAVSEQSDQQDAALTAEKVAGQEPVSDTHVNLFRPSTGDVFKALRTDSIDELLQDGWEISSQQQPAQSAERDERAALTPNQFAAIRAGCASLQKHGGYAPFGIVLQEMLDRARVASKQSTATQPVQAARALTDEQRCALEWAIRQASSAPVMGILRALESLAAQPESGGEA
jgi:hypothetical protein